MKTIKIKLKDLRSLVRECILLENKKQRKYDFGGSHPEEDYDVELLDDKGFKSKSVYVPDDIKNKIKVWAKDMGLSSKKGK